jgi:hypothetical protein
LASEPERKSKGERQKEKVEKEGESKASSHPPSLRTARLSSIINESRASSYRLTFVFFHLPFDFKKCAALRLPNRRAGPEGFNAKIGKALPFEQVRFGGE